MLEDEKTVRALRGAGSCHTQRFVCFGNNLIHDRFHILRPFPYRQLSIRAGAFGHYSFDVGDLGLTAQFVHFSGDELEHFVEQLALVHFAFAPEIDQFSIETVARGTPSIFVN